MRVPATSANLGPGFDCLGMALDLYNTVEMEATRAGAEVAVEGEGAEGLGAAARDLVLGAAERVFGAAGRRPAGLRVRLVNAVPVARGLGSSAAAVVGTLVAANALVGNPLSPGDLLDLAVELEGHPDNATPALFGGVTVSCSPGDAAGEARAGGAADGGEAGGPAGRRTVFLRFDPPPGLALAVIVPDRPLPTAAARAVLPRQVARVDAVFNLQRACLLTAALRDGRLDLLATALEDRLHQPYRAALLPGLSEALERARRAPALLGACLSGSGSSVLVFLRPGEEAAWAAAVDGVADAFRARGLACRALFTAPSPLGATLES